jgi:hypothetical protein
MANDLTEEELGELAEKYEKATPGPWRSFRDGNQYIETRYMPTAKCVGASRLDGVVRPWNPHSYVAFGLKAEEHETARFLDADADCIAAIHSAFPALLFMARRAAKAEGEMAYERETALVIDLARKAAESERDTLRVELDRVTKERDELKAELEKRSIFFQELAKEGILT